MILVGRVMKELDSLSGRDGIVTFRVVHGNSLKRNLIGEKQPVVESVPRINVVTKGDVGQLEREDRSQVLLIRQYIDQPSAEQDRVAHGERFERCGQQHAAVYGIRQIEVVPDDEVIRNCLQYF